LPEEAFDALGKYSFLKVLTSGQIGLLEGDEVGELLIVASGRLNMSSRSGAKGEAGRGDAIEPQAFFSRGLSTISAIAARETLLLALSWDDFLAACRFSPPLLETLLTSPSARLAAGRYYDPPPSRLVLCPAGGETPTVPDETVQGLLAGFEAQGEVRLLKRDSFGGVLEGAITLGAPETAHWLQEQEQSFDLTLIIADGADDGFNRDAIQEADEILLIASGRDTSLSPVEQRAIQSRGAEKCRLLLPLTNDRRSPRAEEWTRSRPCRSVHAFDMSSPRDIEAFCSVILGKGVAVAATSSGVYAAAVLGALQAFEAAGLNMFQFAAAGSALLPAGLTACAAAPSAAASIFRALSRGDIWKRSSRLDIGIYDAAPLDKLLVEFLPDMDISELDRPMLAVSKSISTGIAEVHKSGRLRGAVRAGLAPAGILPPLVLEDGSILVSGENEAEALVRALQASSSLPTVLIVPKGPPAGLSGTPYRDLAPGGFGRLTPFQSAPQIDRKVRLESILSCGSGAAPPPFGEDYRFTIPIPDGIMPLDWSAWTLLRDAAYDFTASELERLGWSSRGPQRR